METKPHYLPGEQSVWAGRNDGETAEHLRWHQIIKAIDLNIEHNLKNAYVLLGFACDEGVERNLGRTGAVDGPEFLKKSLVNLPVHGNKTLKIYDAGTVSCPDGDLEAAQQKLAFYVQTIVKQGGFPLLLGGGHEITYGHFTGLKSHYKRQLGTINLDAHFDFRQPQNNLASSGTGFFQIAQNEKSLKYLPIGIQKISNTQALFNTAATYQIDWIEAADFHYKNKHILLEKIASFLQQIDGLYLTIDLDVFAACYAPGVSAPAYYGIIPDAFFKEIFEHIISSKKLISVDIAELNPQYDIDNRTAKLAADLLFQIVNAKIKRFI